MTEQQQNELIRMKAYRPFMICYCAVNEETGEYIISASPTKHRANKLARTGWKVWII